MQVVVSKKKVINLIGFHFQTLEGQVVHKRSVSSKLLFFDVVNVGGDEASFRITAAFKSWICGAEVFDRAKRGAREERIHVGDVSC